MPQRKKNGGRCFRDSSSQRDSTILVDSLHLGIIRVKRKNETAETFLCVMAIAVHFNILLKYRGESSGNFMK